MEFFIEIDYKTPSYSVKKAEDDEYIVIYKTLNSNNVVVSDHKDRVYKDSFDKCADLDCTQFYTSSFVSGSVSLCGDCLPRPIVPRVNGKDGCRNGKIIQNFLNSPLPTNLLVTNQNGQGDASTPNSKEFYNAWKAASPENNLIAKSTFFIGNKNSCGPDGGCIVSCDSGSVAGCWDTGKYGSSGGGGGTGSFGELYSIGGNRYQVYDPLQIYLAGLIPKGGSFPLLSGNPLQQGTLISGAAPGRCGPPITCFGCPDGPTDPDDPTNPNPHPDGPPNCHGGGGGGGGCNWSPQPNLLPRNLTGGGPVVVYGDFTSGVISTGTQSFDTSRGGASLIGGLYALGGSSTGGSIVSPSSLGIVGTYPSCGDSTGSNIQNSNGCGGGPSCKDLARGNVFISGAPSNLGGGNWSGGGTTWNNFWPSNGDDNGFREPENDNLWGGCGEQNLPRASGLWSSPCVPDDPCSGDGGLNSVLEIYYDMPGDGDSDCCYTQILYGINCNGQSTTKCGSGGFSIGSSSNCPSHSRVVSMPGSGCGSCGSDKCSPPCAIDYSSGKVDMVGQVWEILSDSVDPGSCGPSAPWPSPVNHIGCVIRGNVTGLLDGSCGDFPDSCVNGLSNSVSGWLDSRTLRAVKGSGGNSGGSSVSTNGDQSCCKPQMYSPVLRDGWDTHNCGTEDWVPQSFNCGGC
jgi:hypothetical protein